MIDEFYTEMSPLKLEEFLKMDTNNYSDLKKSLCGRAYELETKIIISNKSDIEKLSNLIKKENFEFDSLMKDFDEKKENSSKFFSMFSNRLKKSKEIKEIKKDHENKLIILNSRLNRKYKQLEENRILLQEIIDKLEERGIIWFQIRKLFEEKIRIGLFAHLNNSKPKPKNTNIKKVSLHHFKKPQKQINSISDGIDGDSGKTFKEKNYHELEELYRILGLTPEEFQEYQIILQHIYHNREKLKDKEIAVKLRMAMAFDRNFGNFTNLAKYVSDFALYNDIFKYFTSNNGEDYASNYKRFLYAKVNNDRVELDRMTRFYKNETCRLLHDSGYGMDYIEKNHGVFELELRQLYTSPEDMRRLIERIEAPGETYEDMHRAFQELIRQEIHHRIQYSTLKNSTAEQISRDQANQNSISYQASFNNDKERDYGNDSILDNITSQRYDNIQNQDMDFDFINEEFNQSIIGETMQDFSDNFNQGMGNLHQDEALQNVDSNTEQEQLFDFLQNNEPLETEDLSQIEDDLSFFEEYYQEPENEYYTTQELSKISEDDMHNNETETQYEDALEQSIYDND